MGDRDVRGFVVQLDEVQFKSAKRAPGIGSNTHETYRVVARDERGKRLEHQGTKAETLMRSITLDFERGEVLLESEKGERRWIPYHEVAAYTRAREGTRFASPPPPAEDSLAPKDEDTKPETPARKANAR